MMKLNHDQMCEAWEVARPKVERQISIHVKLLHIKATGEIRGNDRYWEKFRKTTLGIIRWKGEMNEKYSEKHWEEL